MRSRINTSPTLSTTHSHSASSTLDRLAGRVAQGRVMSIEDAMRQITHHMDFVVHVTLQDDAWRGGTRRRFVSEVRQLTGSMEAVAWQGEGIALNAALHAN